jgi:imidazolonepropionase-like amidohydrolase
MHEATRTGGVMLLTARRLFTGPTTGLLEDHVLEIDDDRIVDIRPRTEARTAGELTDFEDATLLPGLIDVHQHLAFDASADPVVRLDADDDATLLLRMRLAAHRALAVGITTIRDLGDRGGGAPGDREATERHPRQPRQALPPRRARGVQ